MKQLKRQLGKTLVGILLMTMAVSILGVCLGQAIMAGKTEKDLEYQFTTVALESSQYNFRLYESGNFAFASTMYPPLKEWIDETVQAHPELVETVAYASLSSGYIPGWLQENYNANSFESYYYSLSAGATDQLPTNGSLYYGANYCGCMFVVTVHEMTEPQESWPTEYTNDGQVVSVFSGISTTLQTTIDQVISMEAGYEDPTGWPLELKVTAHSYEELAEMDLKVGGQYLVYGNAYVDFTPSFLDHVKLQVRMGAATGFQEFNPSMLHILTEEEKAA